MTPATIAAIILEVKDAVKVIVEFVVVFLAVFWTDFPAREVQHVVGAYERGIERYSEHVHGRPCRVVLEFN